jgi:predicted Zn finger-like uncharacterized protein
MVYATCHNEECEKDEWWLKKPPSEYASGGPKCPDCGTTRVEVDSDGESAEEPESEPAEAPAPAKAEQQQSSPQLSTQEEALQTGAQLGSMVADMGASTPEEKAETQGKIATALGSAIASVGQEMAEQKMEGVNRAKNADQGDVGVVEDYVKCPECGTQITDLPPTGTKFRCPSCNQLLESK